MLWDFPSSAGYCPVVLDSKAYLGILTFIPWDSTQSKGKVLYTYNLLILSEPLDGAYWAEGGIGFDTWF